MNNSLIAIDLFYLNFEETCSSYMYTIHVPISKLVLRNPGTRTVEEAQRQAVKMLGISLRVRERMGNATGVKSSRLTAVLLRVSRMTIKRFRLSNEMAPHTIITGCLAMRWVRVGRMHHIAVLDVSKHAFTGHRCSIRSSPCVVSKCGVNRKKYKSITTHH